MFDTLAFFFYMAAHVTRVWNVWDSNFWQVYCDTGCKLFVTTSISLQVAVLRWLT